MIHLRRTRYWILLLKEIGRVYKTALIAGFGVGLVVAILFWRLAPTIRPTLIGKTERIGLVGEYSPSELPADILNLISSGLTTLEPDGSATPDLATGWEATNSGKTYFFTLRDDIRWDTGDPLVAQDINYNIRSVTFTPVGDHQIRVDLEAPYSPFPTLVSRPVFLAGLRGVGEYRVARIQLKGDAVVYLKLLPVENQKLPAKEYRFYRTESLLRQAYQVGDIDVIEDLASDEGLADWGRTTVNETVHHDRVVTLFFNLQNDLLAQRPVRHALAYAIPEFEGEERAFSPISKTSWAYTDFVKKFGYDPLESADLLEEAGIATTAAELTITTFPPYLSKAQAIADSWNTLGVTTSVRVENSLPEDYQVFLTAQQLPPDPDQYPFWHSTQGTNITHYVNVRIDKLLEDGRQATNAAERTTIYGDFQRRLTDDAPAVFLYYPKTYTIKRGK